MSASIKPTFDPEKLLQFRIPEVRQQWSLKDTAFYALSVGMAQDPMDRRQLRYVSAEPDMATMPSMAVVMAHPGFWLGNPETTVDPSRVLHGEQEIVLARPLPAAANIRSNTKILSLVDKGPGKAAILYTEKQVFNEDNEELIAKAINTTFLRGLGGFGGEGIPPTQVHQMPSVASQGEIELQTRSEQALFYRLNGDYNILHSDPEFAKKSGFERPILHGLCTFGVICRALLKRLADFQSERLNAMKLRFSAPVYPGESIRVETWSDGSFRAYAAGRGILVADCGYASIE
ncbi:MAG: MaoC family dehydratase N-terminal domain-containing protein [Xanthobacteraceae bacterium]|nr:MaoC family dehydratase N-terminal domain-containing protein [Xanthobacteraceae bacterium]